MKRVLIIDDDRNMNEFVSRVLQSKLHCRVSSAYNGIDAFSFLFNEKFDFIILDISMPLISGVEVLEIIKGDDFLKNIPVVMMTANREREMISKIISLGIIDYMPKPLTLDFTVKKISEVIKKLDNTDASEPNVSELAFSNKILIADKSQNLLSKIKPNFSADEVLLAESGLDALKLYIKFRPLKVYLGLGLPIINETIMIKAIRSFDINKNTSLIVCKENENLTAEEKNKVNDVVAFSRNLDELAKKITEKLKKS